MTVKVCEKGDIMTVTRTMDLPAIRKAMDLAANNYIDDDDMIEITEKGRQVLRQITAEEHED